jgi:hypothetical protein
MVFIMKPSIIGLSMSFGLGLESQLQQAEDRGRVDEKVENGLERFIRNERRICWEAEYQNGEFCIGENKVREFFNKLKQQLKGE